MTRQWHPGLAVVTQTTARFTWQDLYPKHFDCRLYDADRERLSQFLTREVREALRADPGVGGLLLGNLSVRQWGCHVVMLTGQSCNEEQTVMNNAYALAATGAAHTPKDVLWAHVDLQLTLDQGHRFAVWLLRNDRSTVPPNIVRPVAQIWMAHERARRERLPTSP